MLDGEKEGVSNGISDGSRCVGDSDGVNVLSSSEGPDDGIVDGTPDGMLDGAKEGVSNGISDGSRCVRDSDGFNVLSNRLLW
jgi:hypothetical protein